jgi:ABC-2 type transport system ATP-binding protein
MSQAVIVENLTKQFTLKKKAEGLRASVRALFHPQKHTVAAVRDISFSVEQGDVVAFIGPNGAGKSTTIKMMTGILYPDAGTISVLGLDPHRKRKELAYRIGTVFGQKSQLWFHLPPNDSFYLLGSIYDLPRSEVRERVETLSEAFEIGGYIDQPVRKLSLGQRIRCEIVASLIHRPQLLFLDEPSIGLDVVVKQRIRDLIAEINEQEGVTIFITSHDAGDIEKICRRAMVINQGKIVWDGSVKQMKYDLLKRRVLDVKTDGPVTISMNGVSVLKQKEYSIKLEVDPDITTPADVIAELGRQVSIQDITVTSTPMEEVITHIYDTTGGSG